MCERVRGKGQSAAESYQQVEVCRGDFHAEKHIYVQGKDCQHGDHWI